MEQILQIERNNMGEISADFIHLVHRLIEECIVFKMSKEECMEALSKHANIQPAITSTVWKELEKENKEFFECYAQRTTSIEIETRLTNLKMSLDALPKYTN